MAWANHALAGLLGGSPEELVGRKLDEIVIADDRQRLERAMADGSRPRQVRVHLWGADREVTLRLLVGPAVGGGHWLTGSDVTGIERTEDVIARLGELYVSREGRAMMNTGAFLAASQALFQSLGWAVVVLSVRSDGFVFEHLFAPEAAEDPAVRLLRSLIGTKVPHARLPGAAECMRTRRGVFRDDAPERAAQISLESHGDAEGARDVAEAMEELGRQRHVVAPVVVGDRVHQVVLAVGPYLTERDFAAVQLFAAQMAATHVLGELSEEMVRQQRLAAVGQLAMLVAHEVRNPLAVIFQACRQLRRLPEISPESDRLLGILDEEAERLRRLVDDLVHFAGPTQPRLQTVDLSEVVHWALHGLRSEGDKATALDRMGVDLDIRASMVTADPMLLRQVLTHLLSHAVEHGAPDGRVFVSSESAAEEVRILVGHEGPPPSEEEAKRLFEPFFSTKAVSSGLGLPVVKRLVEDQGGRVEVDHDAAHCTFAVHLPSG